MKKEDIIAQKLFETCKLSEFYLKLIKSDDESPMQLVYAYKQKLNDIVERYDRLLEAHREREQLELTFETKPSSSTLTTPIVPTGGGVIHSPYKKLPHSASYTRLNLLSNGTTTPNSAATPQHSSPNPYRSRFNTTNLFRNNNSPSSSSSTAPTTPIQSSSKFSTSVFNLSSLQQQHQQHGSGGASNYNTLTKTRRSGLCNSSSSFTISKPVSKKPHSRLDQRTAALYYTSNDQDTSGESDDEENREYEDDDPENELNNGSDDEEEDENEINEYDTEQRLVVKQHIEKSYSNLSKDSGMLSESYHSELNHTGGGGGTTTSGGGEKHHHHLITTMANCATGGAGGGGSTIMTAPPSSSFLESNLNSPYSSNESKSAYDDDDDNNNNEEKETVTSSTSSHNGFHNNKNRSEEEEEEENEPVKDLAANRINFNSLKQSFLLNQQLKQMPKHHHSTTQQSSNLLAINRQRLLDAKITERLNSLSNSRSSLNSNNNNNGGGSSSSSSSTSSHHSPLKKQINLKNLNFEDTSSSSTPSSNNSLDHMDKQHHNFMSLLPTTTTTNNSSIINSSNVAINSHLPSTTSTTNQPSLSNNTPNAPSDNMFMSSYNSLMNVSMLDNIQIANSNLVDYDNTMNSSILMFN